MTIWVDADACPKEIKEILFKAAERTQTNTFLIANRFLSHPGSRYIKSIKVESGFDKADHYIVEHVLINDLLVTGDIKLAADAIEKGAQVISPRGDLFLKENIHSKLRAKEINEQLRQMGESAFQFGTFSAKEKVTFANALDKYLVKFKRLNHEALPNSSSQ